MSFVGPKLVAKESKHVGQEHLRIGFHESFAKTQLRAKRLATKFNAKVRNRLSLNGLAATRVWDVTFVECSVFVFADFADEWSSDRGVLAEKMLEPANGYTKWNGNNGYVHGGGASTATEPSVQQQAQKARLECNLDAVQEEDEEEEGSDIDSDGSAQSAKGDATGNTAGGTDPIGWAGKAGTRGRGHGRGGGRGRTRGGGRGGGRSSTSITPFAPTAQCYVQAFSHFTYRHTRRKMLVCDLQGVLNIDAADEGRAGVFELTDPVIHYRSETGRQQVYGKTDHGLRGMHAFFTTHQCNDVCRLLGFRLSA